MKLLYFNIDFLVILLLHDFVYVCNSGVAPIPPDILHYDNILWRPTLAAAAAASAAAGASCSRLGNKSVADNIWGLRWTLRPHQAYQ